MSKPLFLLLFLISCSAFSAEIPNHNDFLIGMSKSLLIEKFGKPLSTGVLPQNSHKDFEEDTNYSQIEQELSEVVYWQYESISSVGRNIIGISFLYFDSTIENGENIVATGWLEKSALTN